MAKQSQQSQGQSKQSSSARAPARTGRVAGGDTEVVVTDVDISFANMVMLLVKLAFASIPAMIIIWMVMAVIGVVFTSLFGLGAGLFGEM